MGKGKRKRAEEHPHDNSDQSSNQPFSKDSVTAKTARLELDHVDTNFSLTLQIIAGTYERILHGVTGTIVASGRDNLEQAAKISFADNFLFNAHGAAIRCLAVSPSKHESVTLASGSTDQIINLYRISTIVPRSDQPLRQPTLVGRNITESPENKEIGSLQHHASSVNALKFATRSKLLSGADDNTIAVVRTRDWTILSTIKAPIPTAHGRPSGDTAPLGGTPAGINDFAIHPSLKLMVSVSKGEKCMRLWNLVTGKKAGVLNFGKEVLEAVGEGRRGRGEGLKVEWNSVGEEFAVCFERGVAVFGLDSKIRGIITLTPLEKLHQIHYLPPYKDDNIGSSILAVATEDGRIVFYSTTPILKENGSTTETNSAFPSCLALAEVYGSAERTGSRIKDFQILKIPTGTESPDSMLVVAGSSDGSIQVWSLDRQNLSTHRPGAAKSSNQNLTELNSINGKHRRDTDHDMPHIGKLLGRYETGNRITCLKAFLMDHASQLPAAAASLPMNGTK